MKIFRTLVFFIGSICFILFPVAAETGKGRELEYAQALDTYVSYGYNELGYTIPKVMQAHLCEAARTIVETSATLTLVGDNRKMAEINAEIVSLISRELPCRCEYCIQIAAVNFRGDRRDRWNKLYMDRLTLGRKMLAKERQQAGLSQ